jgi:hypothetical protein
LPLPEFFPIGQQVYRIAIINKTQLRNGNCPITNLITKMGVAHTVGPCLAFRKPNKAKSKSKYLPMNLITDPVEFH